MIAATGRTLSREGDAYGIRAILDVRVRRAPSPPVTELELSPCRGSGVTPTSAVKLSDQGGCT